MFHHIFFQQFLPQPCGVFCPFWSGRTGTTAALLEEPASEQLTLELGDTEGEKLKKVGGSGGGALAFLKGSAHSLDPGRQLLARPARAPLSQAPQHFSALLWSRAGD